MLILTTAVEHAPEVSTQTEIWLRWVIQIATIIGGLVTAWFTLRGQLAAQSAKIDEAREEAHRAAQLAEPTGNGFAKATLATLTDLSSAVSRVEGRQITMESSVSKLGDRLDRHIDKRID